MDNKKNDKNANNNAKDASNKKVEFANELDCESDGKKKGQ